QGDVRLLPLATAERLDRVVVEREAGLGVPKPPLEGRPDGGLGAALGDRVDLVEIHRRHSGADRWGGAGRRRPSRPLPGYLLSLIFSRNASTRLGGRSAAAT